MLRLSRARLSVRAGLVLLLLLVALVTGGSFVAVKARAGSRVNDQARGNPSAEALAAARGATDLASVREVPAALESPTKGDRARTGRLLLPRRSSSAGRVDSDPWYLGMAVTAVLLAVGGGVAFMGRRFVPRPGAGALHVVSRVSLSPKHTVYLLRAGGRVLLVGTGPQGAPALISELDEMPPLEPAPRQGEES
jgi:hypothetical protein